MAAPTIELQTPETQAPGARSVLYQALSRAFRSPGPPFWQQVAAGQVAAAVREAAAALPYQLGLDGELSLGEGISLQDLESSYLALFEVGGEQGAPCYIYEGELGGGRMAVLDEVLRFYHWFGLRLNEARHERPDHLATELEFLHALAFQEAAALTSGASPEPLRRAQRDFARLHLEPFLSAVASRLAGAAAPFYPHLAGWALSFCRHDLAYLDGGQ